MQSKQRLFWCHFGLHKILWPAKLLQVIHPKDERMRRSLKTLNWVKTFARLKIPDRDILSLLQNIDVKTAIKTWYVCLIVMDRLCVVCCCFFVCLFFITPTDIQSCLFQPTSRQCRKNSDLANKARHISSDLQTDQRLINVRKIEQLEPINISRSIESVSTLWHSLSNQYLTKLTFLICWEKCFFRDLYQIFIPLVPSVLNQILK